ncbi:MAG: SDR family oxidoreductase [Pseudomonadales bacterium]
MNKKIALVMGGGAGTGRATCMAFSREGYEVVVADINLAGAEETLQCIKSAGAGGMAIQASMAVADEVAAVIDTIRQRYGALHAVSNNGAMGTPNLPFVEITEQHWDKCMSVTLKGVWLCMKSQLPLIEASGGGAIVNVASVSGMRGEYHQSAYAAAKGGVINLSKSAAVEYATRGVRVNTVCPGGINTGGAKMYLETMPELKQKMEKAHAMQRLAEPEEIADAVVYLCSERASFITGHDMVVDGGVLVRSNVIDPPFT